MKKIVIIPILSNSMRLVERMPMNDEQDSDSDYGLDLGPTPVHVIIAYTCHSAYAYNSSNLLI